MGDGLVMGVSQPWKPMTVVEMCPAPELGGGAPCISEALAPPLAPRAYAKIAQ